MKIWVRLPICHFHYASANDIKHIHDYPDRATYIDMDACYKKVKNNTFMSQCDHCMKAENT